jgi:recombinational DNA repair ATPase RecF
MKLVELEIRNIRGICDVLLKPKGKNFVVWGVNGSGKSAIVDAIDFLLTGRILRLTGRGTGNISLSRHGPHIDHKPDNAYVRAIIQLPASNKSVEIKRCMAHPETWECNDVTTKPRLEPIMVLARRGQHVLTRREVLKYITAEGSTRAQEIQDLLNITEIEEIRKSLVRVQNDFSKSRDIAQRAVVSAKGSINSTVQKASFQAEVVLQVVNQNRVALGGHPLSSLRSTDLKMGLQAPVIISSDSRINVTLFEKDVANLQNVASEKSQNDTAKLYEQLQTLISTVRSNPELLGAVSRQQLTQLGISLIDETGSCPLCDTNWPPGKLKEYLLTKLSKAEVAEQYQKSITKLSDDISTVINSTIASLVQVLATVQLAGIQEIIPLLQSWQSDLQNHLNAFNEAVKSYTELSFDQARVFRMLAPENVNEILIHTSTVVKNKYPRATPEQTAWDTLTRLEENLKALEKAENEFKLVDLAYRRASTLLESFQSARDSVLGKLYDDIKDKFVDLYKRLHGNDEENFDAILEPQGAALNFEVDFYGRGKHPPNALHSEGHQDSMGLCLFLALSERLNAGLIDLVILDDVVMSVDSDHRRALCSLLATFFPNRQFLITTHDQTWVNQLKTEGVVRSNGMVELYNWKVDTGPLINYEVDMWDRIERDLQRNDIASAAARLRRGSEQFFSMVCDALHAQVKYKLNGKWELGDFLPSAIGQYRNLLKKAKIAAQSWNDKERLRSLQTIDDEAGQIFNRSNTEQWAVNANVHYNNWASFSEKDFRPVLAVFQELYNLFVCKQCGEMLYLATFGITPASVRCRCGHADWNLTEKEKKNE